MICVNLAGIGKIKIQRGMANSEEELLVCEDKISKLKEIVPEFDHRLN